MFCKKRINTSLLVTLSFIVISCTTYSKDIEPIHVPPDQYRSLNCEELGHEFGQLFQRRNTLADVLDEEAASDQSVTAVSAILFWPAAFTLGGNKELERKYAQIKGEFDAVIRVGIEKRCNMRPW